MDCADPWALVEFWETALGYRRHPEADGVVYLGLVPPEGEHGPAVVLQRVREPRTGKNRAHLDLYLVDAPALIDRLVGIGGTRIGEPQVYEGQWFQVMHDPESNEFCVLEEWVPPPPRPHDQVT